MSASMDKEFDFKAVERAVYARWRAAGSFRPSRPGARPYTIVIPPPNVTGALHMGHALNNTIQDMMTRYHRMAGDDALWIPGTDHAGIATQNVVEREVRKTEGKTRHELGREELLKRIWAWKDQYGHRILGQLEALGASCAWDHARFTMDEGLSRAVREVFCRLHEEGLVYRGPRIVNWCPRCETALADDEVENKDYQGSLWEIRYPGADGGVGVVVATTRPETMLGDVGVAVHPDDARYSALIGKTVIVPLVDRAVPVLADSFVEAGFGTGAVKLTPAHDANDFAAGERLGLTPLLMMDSKGVVNAVGGRFAGLERYEARKQVVAALEAAGLLAGKKEHPHVRGHCYRCDTVIEPYLSTQWFVAMKKLAGPAMEAVRRGDTAFHPPRWTKVYFDWMEGIRDWCISRQIWWGHRIPAWHCKGCSKTVVRADSPGAVACPACAGAMEQDPDVLDTWFSSALWPFSTLGWPGKGEELDRHYPTDLLVTDRGIIFFWVARMMMMGLHFMGKVPFKDVYIHGTILDKEGRKMSKSLGNGIDPLDMIDKYGADAMRFLLAYLTTGGQDVKLDQDRFEMGRNFATKLWNISRFVLMKLEGTVPGPLGEARPEAFEDRWILSRLARVREEMDASYRSFEFHAAAQAAYDFVWSELADWYLELVKPRLAPQADPASAAAAREVLRHCLTSVLAMLHPIMPFVTEQIWCSLPWSGEALLAVSPWPAVRADRDPAVETGMDEFQALVRAVRQVRADLEIPPGTELSVVARAGAEAERARLAGHSSRFESLARARLAVEAAGGARPPQSALAIAGPFELLIPLAGLIDLEKERSRIAKKLEKLDKDREKLAGKLGNAAFVAKAKPEVVEADRARVAELEREKAKLTGFLANLGA